MRSFACGPDADSLTDVSHRILRLRSSRSGWCSSPVGVTPRHTRILSTSWSLRGLRRWIPSPGCPDRTQHDVTGSSARPGFVRRRFQVIPASPREHGSRASRPRAGTRGSALRFLVMHARLDLRLLHRVQTSHQRRSDNLAFYWAPDGEIHLFTRFCDDRLLGDACPSSGGAARRRVAARGQWWRLPTAPARQKRAGHR